MSMIFRMMTAEQAASGRLDVGRLVVASSEVEALSVAAPGETPVRILTPREASRRRLDHAMQERVARDEQARARRESEARERFVAALTGETSSTRGWSE